MKKSFWVTVLTTVIGLLLINSSSLGVVRASTTVNSMIINLDTTWTKANSPYTLTGPVAVNSGVTLTIEAGATVNLNRLRKKSNTKS